MRLIVSWALLSALELTACTTLPDFRVCADLGQSGYCRKYKSKQAETFDDKHLYVSTLSKKSYTWTKLPRVSIPVDDFTRLKTYLDNFCHQNPSECGDSAGAWSTLLNDIGSKIIGK